MQNLEQNPLWVNFKSTLQLSLSFYSLLAATAHNSRDLSKTSSEKRASHFHFNDRCILD